MSSIQGLNQKIKGFLKVNLELVIIPLLFIFVGISAFYIGKTSQNKLDNDNIYIVNSEIGEGSQNANASTPLSTYIKNNPSYNTTLNTSSNIPSGSMYVASSRGKLYYRIGCGGSTKLSPANKIFFNTKEQAEAKGYKPAKNCAP